MTVTLPNYLADAFARVGWFTPAYATIGFLSRLAAEINRRGDDFTQQDLEDWLALLYSADGLAAMVATRYPQTPIVSDFQQTISEAVEAHFLGLHHIAVAGLVPVIEGVGTALLADRGLGPFRDIKPVIERLAKSCKEESIAKRIGAADEIVSMMDSFNRFAQDVLYIGSKNYPFDDKTNRNGIAHGAYRDRDYGSPLNFYKTIGAVDFLCFVAAFRASISWLAPDASLESQRLCDRYRMLQNLARHFGRGIDSTLPQGARPAPRS